MKIQIIHNIVLLIFIFLLITSIAKADSVYDTNGNIINRQISIEIWPTQFKNKPDAEFVAKKLSNGDVFQDHDTKMYQVFYGDAKIKDVVLLSSISDK